MLIVKHSNTSHVSIYLSTLSVAFSTFLYSNTSHVLIYQILQRKCGGSIGIQIHLMFLFIINVVQYCNWYRLFKYISCSYLSEAAMKMFCYHLYSNTSHVLIYRGCFRLPYIIQQFKYISCSYLSQRDSVRVFCHSRFKYISCSYLSKILIFVSLIISDSNTSHVLIYLHWRDYRKKEQKYSNTSHVLIYLKEASNTSVEMQHSNTSHVLIYLIHILYLLQCLLHSNTSHVLIYQSVYNGTYTVYRFKYISCSYLSKTSYVNRSVFCRIQIHLMFLFILVVAYDADKHHKFKYISCSYLSLFDFFF